MSSNPVHDTKHTLACWVSEQVAAQNDIHYATRLLEGAQRRFEQAVKGEQACRKKLAELEE